MTSKQAKDMEEALGDWVELGKDRDSGASKILTRPSNINQK